MLRIHILAPFPHFEYIKAIFCVSQGYVEASAPFSRFI
jgi:hypothetical protein